MVNEFRISVWKIDRGEHRKQKKKKKKNKEQKKKVKQL